MNIKRDLETINNYLSDESNIFFAPEGTIDGVYYPESEEEVVTIFKQANETKTPMTISGGGTGITGTRVPIHGGMVISMEKLLSSTARSGLEKEIYKGLSGEISFYLNEERTGAHFPPGITIQELNGALPYELFYPPDPTETSAQLGGTMATNASGAKCFYYGSTRKWVNGLRAVLANGDVLAVKRGDIFADGNGEFNFKAESGNKYRVEIPKYLMPKVKNAAGLYTKPGMDLIDLFIGSEGILGAFTEINVRLERTPDKLMSDIAFFASEEEVLAYVSEIREFKVEGVTSIEFFDANSLAFIREEHPEINESARAGIFIEAFNTGHELMESLSVIQEKHHVMEDWCADTASNIRDLKEFRHALPDSINSYLKQHQSYKLGTDFVVPQDKFPRMLAAYRKVGESYKNRFRRDGAHYVLFGHIGDCHLHFNFITHTEEEQKAAKELYLELAQTAIKLGGTISGEHGVGKKTIIKDGEEIPYLELMYGKSGLQEIARVKKIFDPNGILNVGNMIPKDYA